MASYQYQLQRVVNALRSRQRTGSGPHAGGWGLKPEPGPSSIVNTAEAISVFELAGALPDDPSLTRGLEYLENKVRRHPDPTGQHAEARGAKARYAAYGLMGLTAFTRPPEERDHADAIAHCVLWLSQNVVDEGRDDDLGQGWSEHPTISRVSVLSTSVAARALDRIPVDTPETATSRELASRARRRLRYLARGDTSGRWWPIHADAPESFGDEVASASLTALAVLALAEGGATSKSYARAGVRWLLANSSRWEEARESDENLPDTNWMHVTSPLCLSAILVPCAGVDPARRELTRAIRHLDRLWSDEEGEWRHGHPAVDVSTSANYHVVRAIRSLRRAWLGFDPMLHILNERGGRPNDGPVSIVGDKPHEIRWVNGTLTILSADSTLLAARTFPPKATAMRALLDTLVKHWIEAGPDATLQDQSVSATEIRESTNISDVYEYVRRLNLRVREASLAERGRSCVLVQRIESGHGLDQDRYALLGIKVTT